MTGYENSYDKYLVENDQFFYDENNSSKGSFLKQDLELYNEEDDIPGASVQVKRIDSDCVVFVNGEESLTLKSSRFTAKERDWLQTAPGFQFMIEGAKQGWKSVSEFKRQLKDKV